MPAAGYHRQRANWPRPDTATATPTTGAGCADHCSDGHGRRALPASTSQPGDSWSSLCTQDRFQRACGGHANPAGRCFSGWLIVEELIFARRRCHADGSARYRDNWNQQSTATGSACRKLNWCSHRHDPSGPRRRWNQLRQSEPAATLEVTATLEPTDQNAGTHCDSGTNCDTRTNCDAGTDWRPGTYGDAATEDGTYVVQPGESWNSIAQKFGVSADALRAANPQAVRPGLVLFRRRSFDHPRPGRARTPPPPTAVPTAAATGHRSCTSGTGSPRSACRCDSLPPRVRPPRRHPEEAGSSLPHRVCIPSRHAGGVVGRARKAWTACLPSCACEALDETNLRSGDWNGDGVDDYAVTIKNPLSTRLRRETDPFIFMSGDGGHTLAYRARPAGQISILAADDINEDGQPDLAWLDT